MHAVAIELDHLCGTGYVLLLGKVSGLQIATAQFRVCLADSICCGSQRCYGIYLDVLYKSNVQSVPLMAPELRRCAGTYMKPFGSFSLVSAASVLVIKRSLSTLGLARARLPPDFFFLWDATSS